MSGVDQLGSSRIVRSDHGDLNRLVARCLADRVREQPASKPWRPADQLAGARSCPIGSGGVTVHPGQLGHQSQRMNSRTQARRGGVVGRILRSGIELLGIGRSVEESATGVVELLHDHLEQLLRAGQPGGAA